jgi:ABC-2 type transport system permease protein
LKLKRSLALLIAVILPLFPAFANFAGTLRSGLGPAMDEIEARSAWSVYFHYSGEMWVIFALPLVVAILSALLANTDHKPKTWKQLFALPFPRSAVFWGKWWALAASLLLSTVVFGLASLASGAAVHFIRPELGLGFPPPLVEAFARPLLAWLLAMLMLSIHLWISLRWPSFVVSIGAGFAASVANIFLIWSYLLERSIFFPWAMPATAYSSWQATILPALLGAALVCLLAQREFVRRDVF